MLKPLAGLLALTLSGQVAAYAVSLANPSFESPVLSDGTHQQGGSGWQFSGPDVGTFNPSPSSYANGAPEGQNVGFIANGVIVATTSETLVANQTYRVRFAVGNRSDNPLPGNATMTLSVYGFNTRRSPDGASAAIQTSIAPPPAGTFVYQDFTFTTTNATPNLGLPIAIQLTAFPTPAQFNIDDFSFNVGNGFVQRSVPVDQPVALIGLGLLVTLTAGYALSRFRA